MRPAQVRVIPGTFINSSTLARLMSILASGGGACADVFGAPLESRSEVCDVAVRHMPSSARVNIANRMRDCTAPFCANPSAVCNKQFDNIGDFPLTSKQMQNRHHHGHHHHHGNPMPADCHGLI